ncbi:MAG: single-stranded DNA-binding protein [Clostridia bacterium]|jgi:single-strand DNA-binding protein|nr:single-stranded DNA-binding protein [Clostridia bacterium]
MAFNKVILVGNLTADPELKTTPSGVSLTTFSIAVNRRFAKSGEQAQTDFFNITAWRQTAEFVTRFFTKGRPILVCGSLQTRTWTDNNGTKHYATDIIADEVSFVDRKSDNPNAGGYNAPAQNAQQPTYSTPTADSGFEDLSADDELPF